ncbi:MAG: efflux RND transporter permease subunit, partial [Pseudomonadota bacterium]
MPLAKLAIRQPIFVSMVLLAVTLMGVLTYFRMGVDLYPDMSNPVVSVQVSFPGASPQDVENLITMPVERSLSSVNGVDSISASSREGSSSVMVSFVIGYDIQQGAQDIRERLDSIKRRLPDGADDPILRRFDPNSSPFMTAALTVEGDISPADKRRMVEEIIQPRLERVAGIAAATVNGMDVQEIGVDLNASKLKSLRITPQQVVSALSAQNVAQPSGTVSTSAVDTPLRTTAEYQSLDDIRRVMVARQGSTAILVQDLATVDLRYPTKTRYNRVNGQETMTISLQRQSGANEVQASALVREELASMSRDFPQMNFTVIRDDSTFISDSDRDVTITLIIGALLAAAIVFLFFRNIRNTLITVAGLPIIVIGTFTAMYALGFTRNIISLMALSLSVGLLIDDAIVVRENIFRHMEAGASPKEAAEKATGEIAFAVLAITLTIVAIFVPVTFTGGQVGRLLNQFGIVVAAAVLISLFEAFTRAPLLTAYLGKPLDVENHKRGGKSDSGLTSRWAKAWPAIASSYQRVLSWALG